MIKAKLGDTYILGIDKENVTRLQDNKPILIDLSIFGLPGKMVVMYGETLDDVRAELEQLTNTNLKQH